MRITIVAANWKMNLTHGPDNARALLGQPDVDGALVGGASLDSRSFAQIVQSASSKNGSHPAELN